MAVTPIPYPGRYVVVKQFTIDRPDAHPLPDTAPLHYYNPYYLRLDLKTHSTRLLHNSIQQTSVDATPEHHAAVVSGLAAAGVFPVEPPSLLSPPPLPRDDRRSCSIVSTGKKTVAFADTVDVCDVVVDDHSSSNTSSSSSKSNIIHRVVTKSLPDTAAVARKPTYVFQVHSQTGEVVGDVLIERKRDPPPRSPPSSTTTTTTPSPVDDSHDVTDGDGGGGCSRRKRHEMFCRRRQSPVYSCDDGESMSDTTAVDRSASSSSVYESCEEYPAVVVLGTEFGRSPLRRSAAAIGGYASCCPL